MTRDELERLFFHEVGLALSAEKVGDGLLSAIAQPVKDESLAALLHEEEGQRRPHVAKFEECFNALGARPIDISAPAVEGLRTRFSNFMAMRQAPEAVALFALGTALRFNYLTIAAYEELIHLSRIIGEERCVDCFRGILQHKEKYIDKLEQKIHDMSELACADVRS